MDAGFFKASLDIATKITQSHIYGCGILKSKALYRVIHKSVKHFKNSQQIDYATDHGNSYVDRERNCVSFFLRKSPRKLLP